MIVSHSTQSHLTIREEDLIKKNELLDPLKDNDDIEWKHNPFDVDYVTENVSLNALCSHIFTTHLYKLIKYSHPIRVTP